MKLQTVVIICLLSLFYLPRSVYPQEKEITIQALNGSTGKPLSRRRLLIFGGLSAEEASFHHTHFDVTTDEHGTAKLMLDLSTTGWIEIFADYMTLCFRKPNLTQFSVDEILTTGVSAPNGCSSITVAVEAGRFTVFARRSTRREKMAW